MNKIDKRLRDALDSGFKKKQAAAQKESNKKRTERDARAKEIKRFFPKAKMWIKENLFKRIEVAESKGRQTIILNDQTDGIPTEAIYQLVQKIDGLHIYRSEDITWEDPDYGQVKEYRYHIEWTSKDPNLNRTY